MTLLRSLGLLVALGLSVASSGAVLVQFGGEWPRFSEAHRFRNDRVGPPDGSNWYMPCLWAPAQYAPAHLQWSKAG